MENQSKITASPEKCPRCEGIKLITGPGVKPHYASLNCGECGRYIRWLPRPRTPQNRGTDAAGAGPAGTG
jgi:hypothetical protein